MRQGFAVSAGFFAIVQTVVFGGSVEMTGVGGFLVLVAAVAAGFGLIAVANRVTNGLELQREPDVKPEAIVKWCDEADDPEYVSTRLVSELGRWPAPRATTRG